MIDSGSNWLFADRRLREEAKVAKTWSANQSMIAINAENWKRKEKDQNDKASRC